MKEKREGEEEEKREEKKVCQVEPVQVVFAFFVLVVSQLVVRFVIRDQGWGSIVRHIGRGVFVSARRSFRDVFAVRRGGAAAGGFLFARFLLLFQGLGGKVGRQLLWVIFLGGA